MAEHGGFEGNAQTLRILTELLYERPGRTKASHQPSCSTASLNTKPCKKNGTRKTANSLAIILFMMSNPKWRSSVIGREPLPKELTTVKALNKLKSIECQIMDWADDTAYSLHDIVDGIHARYITVGSIHEWAQNQELYREEVTHIEKLCDTIRSTSYEPYFGSRIGKFVHGCELRPRKGFLAEQTHRHAFDLHIDPEVQKESRLYKRIALDLIFRSTQIQQIEFKGGQPLKSFSMPQKSILRIADNADCKSSRSRCAS